MGRATNAGPVVIKAFLKFFFPIESHLTKDYNCKLGELRAF